ncbi:E3 ubiquitin/ISG15 ligase TRIM25-like [Girardinichthys multiradiatus]|uniref:E3 ubiquitin/ISG15 ligase TRIM25-like n=1 Tax=Girardinichthys multiradiatus TaxID=208333 RepID=UPI001FAD564A|nr:E3 ubiquitin/ISG15 ligase TRIM25-like [Girardinichthys multiradiatus]
MADVEETEFSLMSLEDELTCSICLSTFDCPVTIPCGHNFCQDCLLSSWTDSYSCPQCRTLFETRPELKKNTVLSTVVETFRVRSSKSEGGLFEEEEKTKNVVRCDTCMEADAAQTCLTCMASFCEEHLRPHRENPIFRPHQLTDPVGDLSEHICTDHHKLMEHFCTDHGRLICSVCLQQVHKGCSFMSPEEQRHLKESEFRDKLGILDLKINRTDTIVLQMNELQDKLKEAASKRKMALVAVYQQIREMLAQDERVAQHEVDCELEAGQAKLRDLTKKFNDNSERMKTAREEIDNLLSQAQTPAFLQSSFELPKVVKFDPHPPRINLDSKRVMATQSFAATLQESLMMLFTQPFEARVPLLKPEPNTGSTASAQAEASFSGTASWFESPAQKPPEQRPPFRSHSPGRPPIQTVYQPVHIPVYIQAKQTWHPQQIQSSGFSRPPFFPGQKPHKKPDGGHQPSHKQGQKPPSPQGGQKPGGKGPDSAKKDKPKSHPPSGKSARQNPHPKKK